MRNIGVIAALFFVAYLKMFMTIFVNTSEDNFFFFRDSHYLNETVVQGTATGFDVKQIA